MSHAANDQPQRTVAVLHQAAGSLRIVIGSGASVVAARTFAAAEHGRIAAWLQEHHVSSVIVVLPSSAVTCRTFTLPDTDEANLVRALSLQAEAHMLSGVPDHRRAMAVLHAAAGETSRSGIVVTWPPVAGDPGVVDLQAVLGESALPVSFAPDVAALAALLNGLRPGEPLLWSDRADGSVAMVISHANGAALRATRVSGSARSQWPRAVAAALGETALSIGHTPAFTEAMVAAVAERLGAAGDASLLVPREIIDGAATRAPGCGRDSEWWNAYGVALGALLAASDQLAPLTQLRLAAPVLSPSLGRRVMSTLSDPAKMPRIVAASLLVAVLSPPVISGVRLAVLKAKLPNLQTYLAESRKTEVQVALYDELADNAWPMSKLLSDIACNTPEAIDIDQIRMRYGERLTIAGRAKPDSKAGLSAQEVVALMQENFRLTNIFSEIHLTWGDPSPFGAYEFTISAKVDHSYHRHEYPLELDYGRWTLADRLYGGEPDDGAQTDLVSEVLDQIDEQSEAGDLDEDMDSETEPAADEDLRDPEPAGNQGRGPAAAARVGRGPRPPRTGAPDIFGDGDVAGRGTNRLPGADGTLPPSQDIPDPLTPEQIQAMDLAEAQETWAEIAHSLRRGVLEPETRERLRSEFRLIRDRIRDLKNQ